MTVPSRADEAQQLLARLGPYAVEFRYLGAAVPAVTLAEAAAAADALLDWASAAVLAAG